MFSLGVTLFYLLSGRLPFADGEQSRGRICAEIIGGEQEAPHLHDLAQLRAVSGRLRRGSSVIASLQSPLYGESL